MVDGRNLTVGTCLHVTRTKYFDSIDHQQPIVVGTTPTTNEYNCIIFRNRVKQQSGRTCVAYYSGYCHYLRA